MKPLYKSLSLPSPWLFLYMIHKHAHTHTHANTHTRQTPLLHFAQDTSSLTIIIFHPCSSPFLTFLSTRLAIHSHCLFLPYDHSCCTGISIFLSLSHLFILPYSFKVPSPWTLPFSSPSLTLLCFLSVSSLLGWFQCISSMTNYTIQNTFTHYVIIIQPYSQYRQGNIA